ncbi:hypothetical protein [Marivivens donghaensis]|uniref:hypothetical protein n=1 Tax=Marivivens donghaensis TaxID=1699413 RepID=UPI003F69A796
MQERIFKFSNAGLLLNAPISALIGCLFAIGFLSFLGTDIPAELKNHLAETMAILVALLGSGIATYGVLVTLRFHEQCRQDDRHGRLTANRILLAASLSEIHEIAELNAKITLANCRAATIGKGAIQDELTEFEGEEILPFISGENLEVFQNVIELTDPTTRNWLAAISNHFQVSRARTRHSEWTTLDDDLPVFITGGYDDVLGWVLVRNLTSNCFDYARGEKSEMPNHIQVETWNAPLRQEFKSNSGHIVIDAYDKLRTRQVHKFAQYFINDEDSHLETLEFQDLAERKLIYASYPTPSK